VGGINKGTLFREERNLSVYEYMPLSTNDRQLKYCGVLIQTAYYLGSVLLVEFVGDFSGQ
jgi:hypothetical protein